MTTETDSTHAKGQLSPPMRPLATANVIADHAALVGRLQHWTKTLLRTRSISGRAILSHIATQGTLTPAELAELPTRSDADQLVAELEPRAAAAFARVLALQPGPANEKEAAIDLLALLISSGRLPQKRDADVDVALYAQLLISRRRRADLNAFLARPDLVARVAPKYLDAMQSDLANPFLDLGLQTSEAGFLNVFNQLVDPTSAPALTLRESGATPLDRLTALPGTPETGPLITVITSTYNPNHTLLNAARSIINQTWESWEMLIVDDASTIPTAEAVLERVKRLDPRIRVIRKAVNGGTYRARNTAIRQARGSFITFLDSDDWAHPHLLSVGVRPMLDDPGIIATRSHGIRVTENLEVTRPGYPALVETATSLMFRFPDVPSRIGFFDTSRKAADTEYIKRIEAAFGRSVLDIPGRALTLMRRVADSLSAADFSAGWRHPSRWAYKQAYGAAHRQIAEGAPSFRDPDGPSTYFGARRWAKPGDSDWRAVRRFDVIFVGDWRRYGGPQVSMMEEISALRAHGLRIGVMHLEAMRFRTARDEPLCEPLQVRLRAGEVELVFEDDDVEVDVMLLRYPPILQFPPPAPSRVRPRRLFIVANQAPSEPDGSDQRYVPADVHQHAGEVFGIEPLWVPQGPTIRRILSDLLPARVIADWDNPGIIEPSNWFTPRGPLPAKGLVVGRYSRDAAIKFPRTADELRLGYGFGPEVEVRFMGATKTISRLFKAVGQPIPSNWTVLDSYSIPAPEFLAGLDIVIYHDDPSANEAFGRVLLESAASGALVIASPKHKSTFGDALLYATPDQTASLVARCVMEPDLVARQRELAQRRVLEKWSHRAFSRRVLAELSAARQTLGAEHREVREVTPPESVNVLLYRANSFGPIQPVEAGEGVEVRTAALRRPADAELFDAVAVIYAAGSDEAAEDLLIDIRANHLPDQPVLNIDDKLGHGLLAVVFHSDGVWWPTVSAGYTADLMDESCRIRSIEHLA